MRRKSTSSGRILVNSELRFHLDDSRSLPESTQTRQLKIMLFAQTIRTDSSPRGYTESAFAHLDRSARDECKAIRMQIENWCARVPESDRNEFIKRFTSGNDSAFHSAFLELYIHELLLTTGHHVLFHPDVPESTNRPDFRATDASGHETIVECTVASEESELERAAHARLRTLYDSISQVICEDVFLDLRIFGALASPAPARKWRTQIQRWVDSLDYESLLAMGPSPNDFDLPQLALEHDGLVLEIKPIPKRRQARGKGQPVIGIESFEGAIVTSHLKIRDTIRAKAGRYGNLGCPFVLVVNCTGAQAVDDEIHAAMFNDTGLWRIGAKAYTRLSAVLAVQHLFPWSIHAAVPVLYHNPHAAFPYSGELAKFQVTSSP